MHRRLLGSMDRSAHRPHGLPSYFCIILHSTRGLRTRTRCACGTPTRVPRSSDDTNACCWSRRGMFIAQRKPCSRAFRPVSARRENRQSHSNSNHAGRKFSESSRRPSICTHGFPDRDLEAWLLTSCRSGNFPGPTPTATPKPPRLRCKAQFLGGSDRSFFGNLQRLYSFVPGQPGYGDKWPSQETHRTRGQYPAPPPKPGEHRFRRGRNRIDEGVKGVLLLGMVPPLSGHFIVANDNYAPVAQAA